MPPLTIAVTGHRPDKLGGYNDATWERLQGFALEVLVDLEPDRVLTGMAQGWDLAIAWATAELGIKSLAVLPFAGQENRWPMEVRHRYRKLLARANQIVVVSEGEYTPSKMQARNEWMVDWLKALNTPATSWVTKWATKLVALWNGSAGGTANCIFYAEKQQVEIVNVWDHWRGRSLENGVELPVFADDDAPF